MLQCNKPEESRRKKVQVVVVDDSQLVCVRIRAMLAEVAEIDVVGEANSAASANVLIRQLKPDAVTLDIHLPDGTGFGVLKQLRQNWPDLSEAPVVIMLSNHTNALYRRKAESDGANYFLDKSNEFEQVREILLSLVCPQHAACGERPARSDAY